MDFIFNRWMGYRKNNITLNLNQRYTHLKEHGKAIEKALKEEGRKAVYEGSGYFFVDGRVLPA